MENSVEKIEHSLPDMLLNLFVVLVPSAFFQLTNGIWNWRKRKTSGVVKDTTIVVNGQLG